MMNRLLAAIALSLLFAFSAAADTTLQLSLLHFPSFDATPGDELRIYPTIWNVGDEAARDVVLTFTLPPGSVFTAQSVPSDWACTADRATMTCRIASIPAAGREVGFTADFTAIVGGEATGEIGLHSTLTAANAPAVEQTSQFFVWRPLTVTTTADSGPGSLREVLTRANQLCAPREERCAIRFGVPGPATFEPLTPLPAITACGIVSIEGGFFWPEANQYELSGAKVSSGSGLEVRANCNDGSRMLWVTGLTINRFPEDGIRLHPTGQPYVVRLADVRIGTDRSGTLPRPNAWRGIAITSPQTHLSLGASDVRFNGRSGLFIWDAGLVELNGTTIAGNGASGIFLFRGTLIGSTNTIAHNAQWGISVVPGAHMGLVHNNSIHSNGAPPIDWNLDGPTPQEHAGGAAAPVVQSATFNAAEGTTTIRGTIEVETVQGRRYEVSIYSNAPGRAEAERWEKRTGLFEIFVPAPGVYPWEVVIPRDLRGRTLTAVTGVGIADDFPTFTGSELSAPFTVQ